MKLKKILPLVACSCLTIATTCYANSDPEPLYNIQGPVVTSFNMKVPVFHLNNPEASLKANVYMETLAKAALNNYVEEPLNLEGNFTYDVKYQNPKLLSMIFTTYDYAGGAHGFHTQLGVTFDKDTGDVIPLDYYLKLKDNQQIIQGLKDGKLQLFSENMENIKYDPDFNNVGKALPTSYYLAGDGGIYVIFPPYALSSYNYGCTRVYFPVEMVNKFNGK